MLAVQLSGWLAGCSSNAAPGTMCSAESPSALTTTSAMYGTAGAPFKAISDGAGNVFVSVTAGQASGTATGVQVFATAGGGLESACVNALSASLLGPNTLFADIDFLPGAVDVAAGLGSPGAIFYRVSDLLGCHAAGTAVSQGSTAADNAGTFDVAVTPDGSFAFVANEYGMAPGSATQGNIGVVAVQRDSGGNVTTGTALIGRIATAGDAIAGMTLSPDGTRLYVTSEVAASGTTAAGAGNPVLSRTGCVQQAGSSDINGVLTVIDVAGAEAAPGSGAIVATVAAGCSPTRVLETADGATIWVSARGDDRVLAFSAARLESTPDEALLGYAATGGTAPVGLALFHGDRLLAVANSNRFNTGAANLAILDVADPTEASVVQTICTGLFPREVTVGSDDATLYLTNFDSNALQVVQTAPPSM
jgi:hypothetical protein